MRVAEYEIERAGNEKLASASGMARKSSEDREDSMLERFVCQFVFGGRRWVGDKTIFSGPP